MLALLFFALALPAVLAAFVLGYRRGHRAGQERGATDAIRELVQLAEAEAARKARAELPTGQEREYAP